MGANKKKIIETEAELIAALSQKGRFMEFFAEDDKEWYWIKESSDGKYSGNVLFYVNYEIARQWSEPRFLTENYGPFCSTWCLPDFWPWPFP